MRDGLFSLFLGVPEGVRVSSLRIMTADLVKEACRLKPNGFFYLSASVFKGSTRPVRAVSIPYRRESNSEEDWNHALFQKKSAEKTISGYSALSLLRLYTKLFLNYTCFSAAKRNCSRGAKPLYRISRRIRAPLPGSCVPAGKDAGDGHDSGRLHQIAQRSTVCGTP